jgi:hypothetical protein
MGTRRCVTGNNVGGQSDFALPTTDSAAALHCSESNKLKVSSPLTIPTLSRQYAIQGFLNRESPILRTVDQLQLPVMVRAADAS